jgi:RNA polymerase sigma factor (sigma-70 family)
VIGHKVHRELSRAELEEARLGYIQFLRRKRFSPQFIAAHGEDLFATAALEYSRKLAEGERIESPAGWLITCAWRRTMSLLEAQGRSPRVLPTEQAEAIEDELGRSPEQAAIEEDRLTRVQAAVDQLPAEERRLLELAYFEEMPVREVARELDWHPSKAQRCHKAAREHLHALLGVESLDELEVIVGLAAYVSFSGGSPWHPSAALEAAANMVGRSLDATWAKAQELTRRLPVGAGSDTPTAAALSGGAGRVAGVCATAAIACLASGVVGPGVGGVNLIGGEAGQSPPPKSKPVAEVRADVVPGARAAAEPTTPTPPEQSTPKPESNGDSAGPTASASAKRHRRATEAVRSQSLESAAPGPEEASATPVETASASYAPPPAESSSGGSGASPTQVANEQFGP